MLFFCSGKCVAGGDSFIRAHRTRILTCVPVAQKLRKSLDLSPSGSQVPSFLRFYWVKWKWCPTGAPFPRACDQPENNVPAGQNFLDRSGLRTLWVRSDNLPPPEANIDFRAIGGEVSGFLTSVPVGQKLAANIGPAGVEVKIVPRWGTFSSEHCATARNAQLQG